MSGAVEEHTFPALDAHLARRKNENVQADMPFIDWACQIREAQKGFLDFEKYPYQREIYETLGEVDRAVVCKGTQVGVSTLALRWALWVAGQKHGTVMYVFPVKDQVYKFSDERVKPVIRNSDILTPLMRYDDPDSKGLKKVGLGYVHFVGSRSVNELDSVPANALVLDEYDELAQNNIPVVLRRVGAADQPMIRYIGVPTLDNYGIHAEFLKTQMRRWWVTCSCGKEQLVTWESIEYEQIGPDEYKAERVCRECRKELNVLNGQWRADYPERTRIGYHVPRLIVHGADMAEVVKGRLSEKDEEKRAHYNRDLAEPYETPESRLSPTAIESCRRGEVHMVESYRGPRWVTAGIDVSSTRGLHVRVSEHLQHGEKRVLFVGVLDAITTANPDEPDQSALRRLAQVMSAYGVHIACIDHLPDGLFAKAFCVAHPGRAYMVAYNTDYRAKETIKVPTRIDDLLVVAKRTEWITITLNGFRWQRNLLPLNEPLPKGVEGKTYEEHLRNMVMERHKDPIGREYYAYKETGPEDFLQCEVYDCIATEVLRLRYAERRVAVESAEQTELAPVDPTPDLSDWDGRPISEDAARPYEGTYGEGWDGADEYRP